MKYINQLLFATDRSIWWQWSWYCFEGLQDLVGENVSVCIAKYVWFFFTACEQFCFLLLLLNVEEDQHKSENFC